MLYPRIKGFKPRGLPCLVALTLLLGLGIGVRLSAQARAWPGLRWLDARLFCQILKDQPGMLEQQPDGSRKILWAKTVRMVRRVIPGQDFPGKDGPWYLVYGPHDPSRWDIEINGQILDPRPVFIEYGGQNWNLGMLFSFPEELVLFGNDDFSPPWVAGP